MAVINGGQVVGIPLMQEGDYFDTRWRHTMLHRRVPQLNYLVERLRLICPDLDALLTHLAGIGTGRMATYVKSRITGIIACRFMIFQMSPQYFAYKMDLILYANWSVIIEFLRRFTKVAIKGYGFSDEKFYTFKILPKEKLYKASCQWAEVMYPISFDMVKHYEKLTGKVQYRKA